MAEAGSPVLPRWRRVFARRRTRVLLAIVLALVVVRIALPAVLRRVAVAEADKAMLGRIEIDDVDLSLLTGGLTLHGFRVYGTEAAAIALPSPSPAASAAGTETTGPVPTDAASPDPTAAATVAPSEATSAATTDAASAPASPAASPAPEAGAGPPGSAPVLSAKRLMVDIRYLPLFRRIVEVERVELDGVAVSLDRAPDGTLLLPAAAPAPEPTPVPSPQGPGWGVLVRSVALHDGRIGFRDFAVGDPPQRVEVTLPTLDASQLALLITQQGVQPGALSLDAGIEGGTLHLDATIESLASGPAYESHVVLTDIPIADSRVYIPKVGWSGLSGRLDADLVHRFESQGAHTVHGTAALHDLDVHVRGLDDPALAWRSLAVDVAGIDFVAQHVDVTTVTLDGARVVTRPAGPEPLPVLRGLMTAAAERVTTKPSVAPTPAAIASPETSPTSIATTSTTPAATATASPPDASPAASGDATTPPTIAPTPAAAAPPSATISSAGARPWTWSIGTLRVTDGHVQAIGDDASLGLGVEVEAAPFTSTGSAAAVRVALEPSSGGTLAIAGNLTRTPLAFDGKLVVNDLQLAALAQPVATATTRLVKNGVASLDLAVAAGATASAPPDGVRVSGTIHLADVDVAGDDPSAFAIRWKDLAIGLTAATAPGVLRSRAGDGTAGPFDATFGTVTLTAPDVTLTRTAAGIALPAPLGGGSPAPAASPAPAESAATAPATAANAAPTAPQPQPAVRVQAERVAIERMRLTTTDTTVQPFFHSTLDPVDLTATAVAWPGPSAKDVKLVAKSADGGVLTVTGTVAPERTRLTAKLADLPLAPFNPYAASTGYGVSGGTARLDSTIAITGGAYDTKSHLVLHELGVTSGEGDALFMSTFGMPLELALSLLTDLQGNVVLDLPIAGDASGMRTGLGTLIGNALTRAILNAITSPLKLIGAVAHIGEKPAALAPQPLAFLAGRPTLAEGEAAKLASLASLLARAPGLRLHLRGEAGDADRRWLREQALRAKLEEESGVFGTVRHLGERGARKAVLAVLAARSEGKTAEVPAEHREWFESAVAEQQVDDAALRALAEARTGEVKSKLASSQGVDAARIVVDEPRITDAVTPAVAVGLGAPAPTTAAASTPASSPSPAPAAAPARPQRRRRAP